MRLISILSNVKTGAEAAVNTTIHTPPRSSSSCSTDRSGSVRKKDTLSLFPDPSRHQYNNNPPQLRITIPATTENGENKSETSARGLQSTVSSIPDDNLTGLAKAKQRAAEARKRDSPPLFSDMTPRQQSSGTPLYLK